MEERSQKESEREDEHSIIWEDSAAVKNDNGKRNRSYTIDVCIVFSESEGLNRGINPFQFKLNAVRRLKQKLKNGEIVKSLSRELGVYRKRMGAGWRKAFHAEK